MNENKTYSPFTLLEIDNRVGNKTAMPSAGRHADAGRLQFVSIGVGLIHGPVIVAAGSLQTVCQHWKVPDYGYIPWMARSQQPSELGSSEL
jgi:hypothetical protein